MDLNNEMTIRILNLVLDKDPLFMYLDAEIIQILKLTSMVIIDDHLQHVNMDKVKIGPSGIEYLSSAN